MVTNRYYYHTNQLWSVIAIPYIINTNNTLTPLSAYTGSLYSNTRLYTGREYDREINIYYNRARYYNSDTGRFMSRDPIWQNDQVNLYTYVRNSPLMYTDRDGKRASVDKAFTLKNENKIICNYTKLRYTFLVVERRKYDKREINLPKKKSPLKALFLLSVLTKNFSPSPTCHSLSDHSVSE